MTLAALVMAALVVAAPASGVSVEPDVTVQPGTGFTDAQVAEIRQLVADATFRTQVRILDHLPKGAEGSPDLHARSLEKQRYRAERKPGVTLVFTPGAIPEYGAFETADEADVNYALSAVENLDGEPQEKFVELVRMASSRTGAQEFEEQLAKQWDDVGSDSASGTNEPASTKVKVARWVVVAVLVVLMMLFVVFRGRAVAGWWRRRGRACGIEEAADRAEEKNLADRAKADVAAFGSAIDAESMDEHDALALWNLALDDYDKASSLLDRAEGPADHRKVIEICARGRDRLAKAQR
ncbi:hypothetical protein ASG90_04810 [Nocardioides sp. Soil797]|nr:hypothetical protein ASG90_04810 [Nocardioides sp. Soil797]